LATIAAAVGVVAAIATHRLTATVLGDASANDPVVLPGGQLLHAFRAEYTKMS
jgi:hypothetical protein